MSEPCAHEREFAGTQRDTLTSFINTCGELVAMTIERDAALATLAKVAAVVADPAVMEVEAGRIRAALEPTDLPKGTK